MKRWMVYVLVVAGVAAIILIITLPGVLNKEPQIELPVQVVNQGEKLSVNLKQFVSDEKVDEVALELIDGPGVLSGFSYTFEPGFSYAGEIAVRIRATDEQGKSSEDEMLVNVIRVNRPPEIDTSPVVVNEGETLSIDLNSIAVDPDGDNLEFSVEGPGELEGSIYTYSPGYNDAGNGVLRVIARDTHGNETARDIPLEIIDVNAPPVVMQIKNQVVNEGERISVDIASAVVDVDGDEIFFSIEQGPGLLEDGLFVYEPSFADAGTKSVIIRVEDSYGNEAFSSFEVEVKDFNRPPKLLLSDIVLNEGDTVEIDFVERVIDPDGDEVSFAIEGPGEIVDGKYKYTPRFGEAGEESVTVFLEDEKGGTSTAAFRIRVNEVNRPPTV
ncbi:Ig-like domain-containing protein, partial [Mesotoga sp. B105.6.4]